MLDLIAERGYDAVTLRELACSANVSSRSFYRLFSGKQDCFLSMHELVIRRMVERIVAAQDKERSLRRSLGLMFAAFTRELERDPCTARLILVDGYAANSASIEQALRAERIFEAKVVECFEGSVDGIRMPPILVKGIVSGMICTARACLLDNRERELRSLSEGLTDWALSLSSTSANELAELDRWYSQDNIATDRVFVLASPKGNKTPPSTSDRELMLAVVAKLVAAHGYEDLDTKSICAAAGTSQKSFGANFDGVADCFVSALERKAHETLSIAAEAGSASNTWADGIFLSIASICARVAGEPTFANLCFDQVFVAGNAGLDCRSRLMGSIAEHVRSTAPPGKRPDKIAMEASVGAIWGILHQRVTGGHACKVQQIAPSLAYIALAPTLGADATISTIRAELKS
jgi:AcrR family transcriptional regulator